MAYPTRIDVHPDAFAITWDDGHESVYPNKYLRYMCGCAVCVSEWSGERVVREETISDAIHPERAEPVGNYAVQVFWSDGHNTGIYAFERLRSICPCDECGGREEGAHQRRAP